MMKLRITTLVLFASLGMRAQTVTSNCHTADLIYASLKKDASRLALRKMMTSTTGKDSIAINKVLVKRYLDALIAVYNATSLPARDTVISVYPIRTNLNPELNGITVHAKGSFSWMQKLFNSDRNTGNNQLDFYINRYNFQPVAYYAGDPNDQAVLRTDSNLNMKALAAQVRTVFEVADSQAEDGFYDVYDIAENSQPGYIGLSYSFGWKDCFMGCKFRRAWNFRIYDTCKVEYKGFSGEPLTAGIADAIDITGPGLLYSPSPVHDRLFLDFYPPSIVPVQISIYDVSGRCLFAGSSPVQRQEISVSDFPAGIYLLSARSDLGTVSVKWVKCD
jgi:hypothetical protein